MLGLGPGEIILVALVIIVVVGPDRLPQFMRGAGRIYGQFRRAADEMRRSLVLEADRQDADKRYQEMRRRREEGADKTPEVLSKGAVPQPPEILTDPHDETPADMPDADEIREQVAEARNDRHGQEHDEGAS